MSTYQLVREQIIPRPLDDAFSFFADARNLETLTPPLLHFEILTPGTIEMQVGTIIQYALRVHGIPIHWTTAISVWNPPFEFVDVQLRGPYVLWHHRHTFESLGDSTRMVDEVNSPLFQGLSENFGETNLLPCCKITQIPNIFGVTFLMPIFPPATA